jgi:hypothetical protein
MSFRYRERVTEFIEKMAEKPLRQKDDVYDSLVSKINKKRMDFVINSGKFLGSQSVLSKKGTEKER